MGKRKFSLNTKIMTVVLPLIIICNLLTFFVIDRTTTNIVKSATETNMGELSDSTRYEIAAKLARVLGIMENVRLSVERSCDTTEEIQEYIYSIADSYPDIIPTGIYCGLTDGTYIDKLWTPGDDWVMQERPWYIEGLESDGVTLGETYMDAQTASYVVTIYTNIRNSSSEVIGVVCADVALDEINEILTSKTLYDDGYVYAVDSYTKMVFSNREDSAQNGQTVDSLGDPISSVIDSMIDTGSFGTLVTSGNMYVLSDIVPGSNFVIVCVAPEADVLSSVQQVRYPMMIAMLIGCLLVIFVIFLSLRHFLKPIAAILGLVDGMHELDLTRRAAADTGDELGQMTEKINSFAGELSDVVRQIKDVTDMVEAKADDNSDVAENLSRLAGSQNTSIAEMQQSISDMVSSMEGMTDSANSLSAEVLQVRDATEEANRQISDASETVSASYEGMSEMVANMDELSELSDELIASVNNMTDGLDGIKKMTAMITAIASQTNLLSLNASIEAARAGEAGRGFAVVAAEISQLANQSNTSANDIVRVTEEMERLVQSVTAAANASIEKISAANGISAKTRESFERINSSVSEIRSSVSVVASAISRVESVAELIKTETGRESESARAVLGDCNSIMDMSEQFDREGEQMALSGQELKARSKSLWEIMDRFTV